ncbi:MAG TPA: hypothetical protein VF303_04900 [Candidatus Nanoarchaeia archaeon]
MSKNNNLILNKDRLNQYILISLTIISAFLAFLFWRNPLTVYDAAGHVSLVRTIAGDFWPKMAGWNANELLGWPQGVFYPSFFHWLAATLSFLTGISTAIKLLISAALVALPASIYCFASTFTQDKRWATIITIVLFLLLLLLPNFLGTGVPALFQIGLLSNFFVLPLLFLFLANLHRERSCLLPALLLSVIVLTHIVASIVAVLYLVLFVASNSLAGKLTRRLLVTYFEMLLLVAVLTSFFWVPFVFNLEYTSGSRHVSSYFLPNITVFIISFASGLYSWRKKEGNIFILSIFSSFIAFVAVVDAFLIRNNGTSFFLYPFHVYRFQPFAYLLLTTAVMITASKFIKFDRWGFMLLSLTFSGLGLIVVVLLAKNPSQLPDANFELTNPEAVSGRFIETFRRTESDPFWYGLQTQLNRENQDAAWAYGLFTDSTPNGPYLGSLIRSLKPDAYPEGDGVFLEAKFVDEQRIPQLLNLFGINYLVNLENEKENVVGILEKEGKNKYFNAQNASGTSLFEIVPVPVVPVDGDWDVEVDEWWLEKGKVTNIPYTGEKKYSGFSPEEQRVDIISSNKKSTYFKLKVSSEFTAPVLAKISYFPYWKAFENGKEIPVYRAAPNLMVFRARGEVELVYKEPTINRIALFISLIGWVVVLGVVARRFVETLLGSDS